MKIKFSAFCGLSRNSDWQAWLQEIAEDLHHGLLHTIRSGKGCRANSNKMYDIYNELYNRKLGSDFEAFMRRRFPYLILEDSNPLPTKRKPPKLPTESKIKPEPESNQQAREYYNSLNRHEVFGTYRPDILSFPQKKIIVDNPDKLLTRVRNFIKDKLAVDYLIVDDRAYIEYFDSRFASVVDKIPREKREIYKYRQKLSQAQDD